jgi:hypothetical protein
MALYSVTVEVNIEIEASDASEAESTAMKQFDGVYLPPNMNWFVEDETSVWSEELQAWVG